MTCNWSQRFGDLTFLTNLLFSRIPEEIKKKNQKKSDGETKVYERSMKKSSKGEKIPNNQK